VTPAEPFLVPLGKYKNLPITEVPQDYLAWLFTKIGEWRPLFHDAIIAEIKRRDAAPPVATVPVVIDVETLIAAGVRALSQRHAGDDAAMKQIANIATTLRRLAGRMGLAPDDTVPF